MKPIKLLSSTIELTVELASLNSEFSEEDTAEDCVTGRAYCNNNNIISA